MHAYLHARTHARMRTRMRQALIDADERSTTHIFRTVGNTERVFKNKQAMKV